MKRLFGIIAALTAFAAPSASQEAIRVEVKRAVYESEQFKVTFVVEGEHAPDNFKWDCPSDFDLVWGPQTGRSSQTTIINGKMTKSNSVSYTYVLLPKSVGVFTVPAATATVQRRTISSAPVEVEVVADGSAGSSGTGKEDPAAGRSDGNREDLYLSIELDKTKVVVGEPVRANVMLYTRANVAGFEGARFPSFDGFWSSAVETPSNIQFTQKRVGDLIYDVALIRGFELIAQQAGELSIEPAELVCLVNVRSSSPSMRSAFDAFFQNDYETVRRRLRTKQITVSVDALPKPQPATFCGGVGQFGISAALTRDSLTAHEAASLVVKVSGKGNISLVEAPKISFPPDFESYDVKVTEGAGSKTFEYPFIPRSHGHFKIGPVRMSYYDLSLGRYQTISAPEIDIDVQKSATVKEGSASQSFVGVASRDVKNLGSDLRFISTQMPQMRGKGAFFVWSPSFIVTFILLVLAAFFLYVFIRVERKKRGDVAATRGKAATRNAGKRLSRANAYLGQHLYTAFYEELHRALLGFAADKLTLDAAESSKDNIRERMVGRGASESAADSFVALLDACEFARYSPSSDSAAVQAHYDSAVEVISQLDGMLERKYRKSASRTAAAAAFLLLLPSVSLSAQTSSELWNRGVGSYINSDWEGARNAWEQIAADGFESAQLYTNIGSACMKQGQTASAVLYFKRALKLDPSYADAQYDLVFARTFCQDRIDSVPEFFLKKWGTAVRNSLSSDAWAVMFLVLLALCLACVLVFALGRKTGLRKGGFAASVVLFVLSAVALTSASASRASYFDTTEAVVMETVCPVRSSPGTDAGTDLFVLHEGTVVRVLDDVGDWRLVELSDGRQGWLEEINLEII